MEERDAFRVFREEFAEDVVKRAVLPVAGGSVARGELGWKRDDAVQWRHRYA
jgi:hypothetical protein